MLVEKTDKELQRSRSNCDDISSAGYRTDGVYLLFSGKQFFNVFCEFNKDGHNWMVNMCTNEAILKCFGN